MKKTGFLLAAFLLASPSFATIIRLYGPPAKYTPGGGIEYMSSKRRLCAEIDPNNSYMRVAVKLYDEDEKPYGLLYAQDYNIGKTADGRDIIDLEGVEDGKF